MSRIALALVTLAFLAGCAGSKSTSSTESAAPETSASSTPAATPAVTQPVPGAPSTGGKVHKLASGLVYEDLLVGNGKMADPGLEVRVNYTGWLSSGGEPFDSSDRSGQPYQFVLGAGGVIAGWEEGIKGMRVGGKRKLTIPPHMGYGSAGYGAIPPNATLVFDVELVGAK